MKTTSIEAYPHPIGSDLAALPAEIAAFALAQDVKFPTWDAAFAMIAKSGGFVARSSANLAAVATDVGQQVTFDTIDFQQGAAGFDTGTSNWRQPPADGPSLWFFGWALQIAAATGTPTAQTLISSQLIFSDTDPTTGVFLQTIGGAESVESNTAGEWIEGATLQLCRRPTGADVFLNWIFHDTGGATKRVLAGSTLFGFRVTGGVF